MSPGVSVRSVAEPGVTRLGQVSMDPVDPAIRASDADRELTVERLREAHAEGRLTAEEFSERVDEAYAARTHGDLAPLTRDLPSPARGARTGDEATPARRDPSDRRPGRPDPALPDGRGAWGVWAAAVLVNVVVWAVVSLSAQEWIYFWPVWVAGPWGAVLLAGWLFRRR